MAPSKNVVVFFLILIVYAVLLYVVYANFPGLKPEERQYFKLPRSIDDAKQLGKILSRCKDDHYYMVLAAITVIYTFLQSFAIPGSIMLSIMSGYLFPMYTALMLVCFCSAFGASICYYLSLLVIRRFITKYIPDRVNAWQVQVEKERGNLYNYVFFLRVTPILPNWFINLAGPIVKVPLKPFFVGTFLGVMPPSVVMIRTGTQLQKLSNSDAFYTYETMALLVGFGLVALLPIVYKRYRERWSAGQMAPTVYAVPTPIGLRSAIHNHGNGNKKTN